MPSLGRTRSPVIPPTTSRSNSNTNLSPSPSSLSATAGARHSTSSNRSLRKTEADFEAALLHPESTIFISAGPPGDTIGEEGDSDLDAVSAISVSTITTAPTVGPGAGGVVKNSLQPSPEISMKPLEMLRGGDEDAPLPIEKRSFEEDLRDVGGSKTWKDDRRIGLGIGESNSHAGGGVGRLLDSPVKGMPVPGVIPPTPSTSGHARRSSQMTMGSITSAGTGAAWDSPTGSRRASKSLGIDAELGIEPKSKTVVTKRRSIFRSPGTASSPDLATLVRKAKEAKATNPNHGTPTSTTATTQSPAQAQTQTKVPPPLSSTQPTQPSSSTNGHRGAQPQSQPQPQAGPSTQASPSPAPPSPTRQPSRGRSATGSGQKLTEEQVDGNGNIMGTYTMATVAEGSRSASRSRQNSADDGFKSMRSKARGVFGKMFSSAKDTTPSTSTASSSSRPPVPPVPSAYVDPTRKTRSPVPQSSDVFGTLDNSPRQSLRSPHTLHQQRVPSPIYEERRSMSPTTSRQVSSNSILSMDKPLPAVRDEDDTTQRSASETRKSSLHVRQPASTADEQDSPPRPAHQPSASPATAAVSSFSDDMAGMLADIGQSEPARELGLPPDSLRSRNPDKIRSSTMDTAREVVRSNRLPSDLGRPLPSDDGSRYLLSPVPTQRTSSLPTSPKIGQPPAAPQRTASSPHPSMTGDSSLMPVVSSVSRSSSRSSTRRSSERQRSVNPPTNDLPSASMLSDEKDVQSEKSISPLLPQSVKLVSSPRPDSLRSTSHDPTTEGLAKSSFIHTSPWGKQTPRMRSNTQASDQLEIVNSLPGTPSKRDGSEEEDEEEKGRRLACEFLEGDYSSIQADRVAEFLGGPRTVNNIALKYYMQYFDMKGQNLVDAFRELCQKLHLKAESQEIDRIIEGFSARYFDCNPTTVFGTPGVVHTVTAAMLMLNTDLHIAELNKHMSRTDFIRNAMRAINESIPGADRASTPDLVRDDSGSVRLGFGSTGSMAPSFVSMRAKTPTQPPQSAQRSTSAPIVSSPAPPSRTDSTSSIATHGLDGKQRGSSTTVSSFAYGKAWEVEAEAALRDIYSNVRADKILLPISGSASANNRQSMISINSTGPYDGRSKTVRSPSDRVNALKRGSIRGVQGLLNNPYGSQWSTSDGRLSPTPSYATSINEGFGSFAPTLGFASNLSHTVIREHDDEVRSINTRSSVNTMEDMDDDELALLGAPWAKEGLLSRKLYWEAVNKRAKKNDWKQYFTVISKGELYMFTFGEKGGSNFMGGSVGGGNWMENANANGRFSLMHTMAVALPKPGYNASRPYCFSLALPTGETSFFQAGTEDLVTEWVSTCNYWAARKSRQPLQGGVSNMEYGWNRVIDSADDHDQDDKASVRSAKSNLSKLGGGTYGRRGTGSGVNDRVYINDWKPPLPATIPSSLDEEAQLEALQSYVRLLVDELEQHKSVEEPMKFLFSPGSKNLAKARDNWKAKSHYIHTEIFKYETYVEALRNAISLRVKKQGEKKLEKSLATSMKSLNRAAEESDDDKVGDDAESDVGEEERAVTPNAGRAEGTIRR
ncbi:hypothetical protein CI109_106422 [Kwoniella shandongensis]|uniref:Uncharacterized protein n=1 Tax=Kwoniella shandongensis TaxID=1734106 RepID=A0A5M6C138_9TREE|nr:uncharacterized protein CI109_002605 [Kwoniella shandongensis]KAA5528848.1 hypothetical protein CI109_002605 [Kwoniella shandongensis]